MDQIEKRDTMEMKSKIAVHNDARLIIFFRDPSRLFADIIKSLIFE